MIIDLDEFVYARAGYARISDFLREGVDDDVSSVSVVWKMFGSSGHNTQPVSVIDGFTNRRQLCLEHIGHQKQIHRIANVTRLDIHTASSSSRTIKSNGAPFVPNLVDAADHYYHADLLADHALHLNHYAIQSREWFEAVKMTRGAANCSTHDHIRNEAYFVAYDYNDCEDTELASKRRTERALASRIGEPDSN